MTGALVLGFTLGFFSGIAALLFGSFVGRFIGRGRDLDCTYDHWSDAQ